MLARETTIFCSRRVRELWPARLPREWRRRYPQLFDEHDVELTKNQPRNHFAEWYPAIHLFQRDGVLSLVEKYAFLTHTLKHAKMEAILGDRLPVFKRILAGVGGQPPDLLLYTPAERLLGFAEIKGPGDRITKRQVQMHREIRRRLRVPVEVVNVRLVP